MNNNSKDIFDKRLVAIVISIALVFVSLVGFTLLRPFDVAYAAAPMGSWTDTGNYDTSWYYENENEFTLATPTQFAGLAYLVNNGTATFSGKTIKLGADIDLDGHYWTPIGTAEHTFNGKFDGQWHTISNMTVNTDASNSGLFGYVRGTTIRNVTLASSCLIASTANSVGGIVGMADTGTAIENVTNNGTVSGTYDIGGIVGKAHIGTVIVKNATNSGNITGTNNNVGGIIGTAATSVGTFNCRNSGTIKGSEIIGGIVGYVNENTVVICNSYNLGTVYASNGALGSGGILGAVGHTNATANILNCYNAGGITGNGYKGGIVGVNYGKLTISNAYYLDNIADALGINVTDQGATYTGTATQMTDANMKGDVDENSLVSKLNEYVNNNNKVTIGTTEYALKLWNATTDAYPTLSDYPLIGIAVTYNGGYIIEGEKIQGDKIVITATYSDDSTATISADNENVSYWLGEELINDPINYRFNTTVTIAVTVKYNGQEAVMQLTVIPPIVNLTATYTGGEIAKGEKIQGDKLQVTVICEGGSTLPIAADDENISYWVDGEQIEDPINHVFDEAGEVEVTVKYKGQETVMTLTVADDAPTPSASASATSTATATASATATPTATATAETSDGGLSIGAIAGIVGAVIVLGAILLIYFDQVKKK